MPGEIVELLKKLTPRDMDGGAVTKYAKYVKRLNLTLLKMLRKVSWRIMIQTMPGEVARFAHSKFGELRISEEKYEDLLSEADEHYPKYLNSITTLSNS
ncbi:MAG: hypothetical protein QW301_04950 [Desulfurococcaceae archaeon]